MTALLVYVILESVGHHRQVRRISWEEAWQGWVRGSCLKSLKCLEYYSASMEASLRPYLHDALWLEPVFSLAAVHEPSRSVCGKNTV